MFGLEAHADVIDTYSSVCLRARAGCTRERVCICVFVLAFMIARARVCMQKYTRLLVMEVEAVQVRKRQGMFIVWGFFFLCFMIILPD